MITRSIQVFTTLPEDFYRGKMDFYHGSSPPTFICFSLENQNEDESLNPTNSDPNTSTAITDTPRPNPTPSRVQNPSPSPPPFPPISLATRSKSGHDTTVLTQVRALKSPACVDSEPDVTAFAEAIVERMESQQLRDQPDIPLANNGSQQEVQDTVQRASTPILPEEEQGADVILTQLESGLQIAPVSRAALQELLPQTSKSQETLNLSGGSDNDGTESSVNEVPVLPLGGNRVRFLTDLSEGDQTAESFGHSGCPELYGRNPFDSESGTEGDESELVTRSTHPVKPSTSAIKRLDDGLPELSGRSRAVLKTYFDEAKTFRHLIFLRVIHL